MIDSTTSYHTDTDAPSGVAVGAILQAARAMSLAGRWSEAAALLDAVEQTGERTRALISVVAAEIAVESAWYCATDPSAQLDTAEALCSGVELDPELDWDLRFLIVRGDYQVTLLSDGSFRLGPQGKSAELLASIRSRCSELSGRAPDDVRRGWAEMYLGLIADNLFAERNVAPAHYEVALTIGEGGDQMLAREALRHLGDHDHDRGDRALALKRWRDATEHGARSGAVPGTLTQQLLLAVIARDSGDESGAVALCEEIRRWAEAIGASRIAQSAADFLSGFDPTAAPEQ